MRYFYKPSLSATNNKRSYSMYSCDHICYSYCTLFKFKDFGLAVVQQRYDADTKSTTWGPIEDAVAYDISVHPNFKELLIRFSKHPVNGIYPTVPVRKLMWALRMKPLKKEPWETTFDRQFL